jgi:hypothetical protein
MAFESRFQSTCSRPVGVAGDEACLRLQIEIQAYPFRLSHRANRVRRGLNHVRQIDGAVLEPELACHDTGDVEQIVDKQHLRLRIALNDLERAGGRGAGKIPSAQHARPADDRGDWRAQLVRHRGKEIVLGAAGCLGGAPSGALAGQELLPPELSTPPFRDVAEDQHDADDLPGLVADRGGRVVDVSFDAVAPQKERASGERDDAAFPQDMRYRALDRLTRGFADDRSDLDQRPASCLASAPAGQ